MKHCLSSLAAACLLTTSAWSLPFHSILEEDVDILLSFRSLAESRESWSGHPFAKLFNDPEVQAFFAPMIESTAEGQDESFTQVMENEFGLTWDEFFELFSGEFCVALYNLPEVLLGEMERPELVIMAEYNGDAERLAALWQVQFERNATEQKKENPDIEHTMIEEPFMGETLYLDETFDGVETYIEDGYALVGNIFVLATPETTLRAVVEAIKDEPEAALSNNEIFLRSQERGGRGDLSLYFNLEAILPPLNQAMLTNAMNGGVAMFGLSGASLDRALSLESLQAMYFDFDLIEEGMSTHSGLIYREKTGLASLMTYGNGPLPDARYVPETVFSTSVTNFDLGEMFAQFESLLGDASPTLPSLLDIQLQSVKTQTGVDLRTAILENFGGNFVSLSSISERDGATVIMKPEQVILVELRDAEALSGAFEAWIDMVPGMREMIEIQEFAGELVHTVKGVSDQSMPETKTQDVSYVITRSHFILNFGEIGLLKNVLTRIESGEDGFWQSEKTEKLFERISMDRSVSRSYADLEQLVVPMLDSIVQAGQLAGEGALFDGAKLPRDWHIPFHAITEINEDDDGFFSRTLIIEKKELAQ